MTGPSSRASCSLKVSCSQLEVTVATPQGPDPGSAASRRRSPSRGALVSFAGNGSAHGSSSTSDHCASRRPSGGSGAATSSRRSAPSSRSSPIPYQVFELTHSSLDVGLIGLAQIVPGARRLALRRLDRRCRRPAPCSCLRRSSRWRPAASGLALNASAGTPALWPLYVLSAVSAGLSSVDSPTRSAVFANLVGASRCSRAPTPSGSCCSRSARWPDRRSPECSSARSVSPRSTGSTPPPSPSRSLAVASLPPLRPAGGGTRFGLRSIAEGLRYLKGRQVLQGTFVVDLERDGPRHAAGAVPGSRPRPLPRRRRHRRAALCRARRRRTHRAPCSRAGSCAVRKQGRAVLIAVTIWGVAIAAFGLVPWLAAALVLAGGRRRGRRRLGGVPGHDPSARGARGACGAGCRRSTPPS